MRKNNNGVTLIALIVTIIVLIIIAGISIATLTGDNGLFKQTDAARATQIQGTAKEQVELGCGAIKIAIEEAAANDASYAANENADAIQNTLIDVLNKDKQGLDGDFKIYGDAANKKQDTIKIFYDGQDFKNANNSEDAKIVYTIVLGKNDIALSGEKAGDVFTVSLSTNVAGVATVGFTGNHSGTSVDLTEETELTFSYSNANTEFFGWYVGDTQISTELSCTYIASSDTKIIAQFDIPAGLYDEDLNLVASWDELVNNYGMDVETNYTVDSYYETGTSPACVLNNNEALAEGTNLVIGNVSKIGDYAFTDCINLTSITIPDSVTSIGDVGFCYCRSLISVTIPDSVTSIGDEAFDNCRSLISVTIPDGVTSIGNEVFNNCTSLTSITIPDSVTSIGNKAFRYCTSLTSITISDSVISIGNYAFYDCTSLESITISDGVTSIGTYAFQQCTRLKTVYYKGTLEQWCGISIESNMSNPCSNGAELYIGDIRQTDVVIPNTITELLQYTFQGCTSLTSVNIPDSVTSIGEFTFQRCSNLTNIEISNSVTTIGKYAFSKCPNLNNVNIPDSVTSISEGMFWTCTRLTSVTISDSVISIGNSTFSDCTSLTSVTIPENVTSIGNSTFSGCTSLTSVTIPENITSIGNYAFKDCANLTIAKIPDGVTSIGNKAFYGCTSLESIIIPDSVTSIGNYAFCYCKCPTSVTIPDGVTRIGSYTFFGCTSLTSVTIPDSVTKIGEKAFCNCEKLNNITYKGTKEQWNLIALGYRWNFDLPTRSIICSDGTAYVYQEGPNDWIYD